MFFPYIVIYNLKLQKNRFYKINDSYLYDSFTNKIFKLPTDLLNYLLCFKGDILKTKKNYRRYIKFFYKSKDALKNTRKLNNSTLVLKINPSNICNLKCEYCFCEKKTKTHPSIKLTSDTLSYCNKIVTKHIKGYWIDYYMSGEFFLDYNHLATFLSYITKKQLGLLTDEELEGIDLDLLKIKLDNQFKCSVEINKILTTIKENPLNCLNTILEKEETSEILIKKLDRKKINKLKFYEDVVNKKINRCKLNRELINLVIDKTFPLPDGKWYGFFFQTNGTTINEKHIKLLKEYNINELTISLDGPQHINDKIRKFSDGTGSYKIIESKIKLLKQYNLNICISSVITNLYPYPYEIANHFYELGIKKLSMRLVKDNKNLEFSKNNLELLLKEYDKLYEKYFETVKIGDFSFIEFLSEDNSLRIFKPILCNIKYITRCDFDSLFSINSEGEIYPCDYMHNKQFYLGSIYGSKKNNSKKRTNNYVTKNSTCKKCWARYLCGGTCLLNNLQHNGDILLIDETECFYRKYLISKSLELMCSYLEIGVDINKLKQIFK